MERIQMSRIADTKAGQVMKAEREIETQPYESPQTPAAQADVPCSCPGCFPFQF